MSIRGKKPGYEWKPNLDDQIRTIKEAVAIAKKWGVEIPHYVSFHRKPMKHFDADTYARATELRFKDGVIIRWEYLFNSRTGKIPFHIREDILQSDEAIVALFGHEMFELELLRKEFDSNHPIEHWDAETDRDNEPSFHCEAWDYADKLIENMRAQTNG